MVAAAELVAFLRADARQFSTTMQTAAAEVGAVKAETSSLARTATTAFAVVGVAALVGIGKAVATTVEWAGEVRSLQRVTGQTAESASALVAAGNSLGLSVTQLTTGFGIFQKNVTNATTAVQRYGIQTRDARGNVLPFDQVLGEVADKFVTLGKGQEQTAFAMNLFGRSGKAIIPILAQGSAGITALTDEAERMGLVMSQDDLDAARNLSIAQRQLGESFKGVAVTIGTEFLPAAKAVIDFLTRTIQLAAQVPGPVYAVTLGFLGLTGVVSLFIKLGQGILTTWGTVVGAFTGGSADVVASEAAAAAATEASSAAMVAALEGVTVAVGELTIALGGIPAGAASAAIGQAEIVAGAEAATAALTAEAAAAAALPGVIGSASAAGGIGAAAGGAATGGIGAAAGGVIAKALPVVGVAAGAYALGSISGIAKPANDSAAAMERLNTLTGEQAQLLKTLQGATTAWSGSSRASIKGFMDITRQQAIELGATAQAFDFAAAHGLTYGQAVGYIQSQTERAVAVLTGATTSLDTPLVEATGALLRLGNAAVGLQAPFATFARFSGQDVTKVSASLADLLTNAKATGNDVVAVIQQMKSEFRAWHDSLVQSFGGAGGALEGFANQTHVDLGKAVGALRSYTSDIKTFGNDVATIQRRFGHEASSFIAWASSQGLAQKGLVAAVAHGNDQMAQSFVDNFRKADAATGTLATQIQNALDPTFKRIILQLKNVVRVIQGMPPIKLEADTSDANAALNTFFAHWNNAHINLFANVHPGSGRGLPTPPGGPGHGGGLATAAGIRRHHEGGLMNDELLAVLQSGEFVMSRAATSRLGLGVLRALNESAQTISGWGGGLVGGGGGGHDVESVTGYRDVAHALASVSNQLKDYSGGIVDTLRDQLKTAQKAANAANLTKAQEKKRNDAVAELQKQVQHAASIPGRWQRAFERALRTPGINANESELIHRYYEMVKATTTRKEAADARARLWKTTRAFEYQSYPFQKTSRGLSIVVRPDRQRFTRDIDYDFLTSGW